jgi:hypothetical protein
LLGRINLFTVPRPDIPYFQVRGELGAIGPKDEPDDYVYWWKRGIGWLIAGGESGPGARPMHPGWASGLRDQCEEAGVPFFFKQNGEYVFVHYNAGEGPHHCFPDGTLVRHVGTKAAGATLDGREWHEFPKCAQSNPALQEVEP